MITEVGIQNYKSISDLKLELGRVTVLIGENGSGKSNILEAIALGSAAASNKLDNEFLFNRGIRVTPNPKFMRAAFDKESVDKDISLFFRFNTGSSLTFKISNDNHEYSKWRNLKRVPNSLSRKINRQAAEQARELRQSTPNGDVSEQYTKMVEELWDIMSGPPEDLYELGQNFLIYSPENTCLRSPRAEGQIEPLGIHGEGFFRFLHYLSTFEDGERLKDVKQRMQFLEWFRDFKTSKGFADNVSLEIQDNFVSEEVGAFDQLSANEGFLFLLFYFCLLVGAETPRFFAIDNVDTSLNPKLCTRLVKEMAVLAKKYDKQLILTTHNPAILDGLNLDDDEQRLYVVGRDIDGHTEVQRVLKPKPENGQKPVRLSEAFLRGYIGGLPENF